MNQETMDLVGELILYFNPPDERYYLIHRKSGIRSLLSDDITPMNPEYHERILVPAMARIKQELETIKKGKSEDGITA